MTRGIVSKATPMATAYGLNLLGCYGVCPMEDPPIALISRVRTREECEKFALGGDVVI